MSPSYPALEYGLASGVGDTSGLESADADVVTSTESSTFCTGGGCAFCLGAPFALRAAFFDAHVMVDLRAYP